MWEKKSDKIAITYFRLSVYFVSFQLIGDHLMKEIATTQVDLKNLQTIKLLK